MEIRAIQEYLDKNLVDADSVYASYSLGSLLQLGQNGDKKAKLQVLVTLKGLMYNSLKLHMAYLWLPEDDTLQMLSETVLQELKGWNAADPEGFCTHISHCFKNIIRNGVRRSCNHKVKEFSLGGTPEVEASPAEKLLDAREWENFFDSDRKATQQFSVRELFRLMAKQKSDGCWMPGCSVMAGWTMKFLWLVPSSWRQDRGFRVFLIWMRRCGQS